MLMANWVKKEGNKETEAERHRGQGKEEKNRRGGNNMQPWTSNVNERDNKAKEKMSLD